MWNFLKEKWPLFTLAGVSALSVGMVVGVLKTTERGLGGAPTVINRPQAPLETVANRPSAVLQLVTQPATQRTELLSTLTQGQPDKLESYRARYLLATDLIAQGKAGQALPLLTALEKGYRPLAPYVILKRGEAQAAAGDRQAAQATWSDLVANYSDQAATAEALYQLGKQQLDAQTLDNPASSSASQRPAQTGKTDTPKVQDATAQTAKAAAPKASKAQPANAQPAAWDQLLADWPEHPRSIEVALDRLAADQPIPQEKDLLLVVVQRGLHQAGFASSLDRLVAKYGSGLTPEQWQAVAFGYWETDQYGKAGEAYSKAPISPLHLYRAARGLQLGQKRGDAIATYRQLAQEFPTAPETANGLFKLSEMVPDLEAIKVFDQIIANFPDRAGEALLDRADRLANLGSPDSAKAARASVLSQYSGSVAAADLRFDNAKAAAKAGDYAAAISWAQQVTTANADHELAAEAGFWAGKWALKQNQQTLAQKAFETVIKTHPDSYYAWRSAVLLGWDVGNFQDLRTRNPEVRQPAQRQPLPAGSPALQELYLLGQDQDAWILWQTEFKTAQNPSVAEQFTDGVLRLGVGKNIDGIYEITSLALRTDPADLKTFADLKQQPSYWQGVYPFPYGSVIQTWAQQRQLNPLLVTALIRQESRFEAKIQSSAGATGLMQVMPATADWIISKTGDSEPVLDHPEDNIKLGTWYLDYTHSEYNNDSLFAIASYNAGPGNVAEWIKEYDHSDPDEFVNAIPFSETQNYVKSVFGNYWNYLRLYNPEIAQQVAKYTQTTVPTETSR